MGGEGNAPARAEGWNKAIANLRKLGIRSPSESQVRSVRRRQGTGMQPMQAARAVARG